MSFAPESETPVAGNLARPEAMLRVPLGLASPLWGLFAGAAMTGATWWWMSRWARPQNLEAMFGAAAAAVEPEAAALAAPAAETVEAVVEAPPEAALETLGEAEQEVIVEALEGALELEAVGGESAPISPVLEALSPEIAEPTHESAPESVPEPAAKPKKKATAPASGTPD